MYSQYQSSASAPSQQQQQQQTSSSSTTTNGLQWNGSQWVSVVGTSTATPSSSIPQQPSQNSNSNNTIDRVQLYTSYYHGWTALVQQEKQQQQQQQNSNNHDDELARTIQWHQYYADQSSRAAHYYHEQNASASSNINPPPFELPPAPPNWTVPQSSSSSSSQSQRATSTSTFYHPNQNRNLTTTTAAVNSNSNSTTSSNNDTSSTTTTSLARYVQRCVAQCTTQAQKDHMQALIERRIATALQQHNLHTHDWDVEPLLSLQLPGGGTLQATSSSYYGATAAAPATTESSYYNNSYNPQHNKRQQQQNSKKRSHTDISTNHSNHNNSYYGPSSNTHTHSSSSSALAGDDDDFISFSTSTTTSSKSLQNHKNKKSKSKKQKQHHNATTEHDATLLAKRANRFSGKGGLWNASMDHHGAYRTQLHDRYMGKGTIGGNTSSTTGSELDFEQMTVQGTCQVLEKDYLRLTAPPQAALVRPQPILERHLQQLQQAYYTKNTTKKKRDYLWLCSQLKAVRQDCTVQRITNAFAIRVYETHARIALQEDDWNEFNQCQTQLKELYVTNEENDSKALQHQSEFLAYRLLYYVFLSMTERRGSSSSTCADMLALLRSLRRMIQTNPQQQDQHPPAIQHALQVRHAQAMGDYHSFFQLHASAPNLGRCLTQRMVATMQWRALVRIAKAYRPTVAIDFVLQQLGFFSSSTKQDKNNDEEEKRQTGRQWLLSCGCILTETEFITKDSVIHEPQEQIKNSLI